MNARVSRFWSDGTPEGIFGVYAGPEGPWLFGEPDAPIIPATWLLASEWDIIVTPSGKGGVRVRLSQSELATPGAARKRLPRIDLTELAEPCVEARSRIGSWSRIHLGEVYEEVLPEAATLPLSDLPLLTTTHAHLRRLGQGPDDLLSGALDLRRRDFLRDGQGASALIDVEMMLGHWLMLRSSDTTWQRMLMAATLTENAQAFAARYVATSAGVQLSPMELIRRRGWGVKKATLEELGEERGVTRERMRQIFVVADKRLGERRWPLSPAVETAAVRMLGVAPGALESDGRTLGEHELGWTEEALFDLMASIGHPELAARVRESWSTSQRRPAESAVRAVREHRDRLGFLDLTILSKDRSIAAEGHDALELIRWVYPRVVTDDGFVLSGTEIATPAERIAGQQFFVTETLTPFELREGLVRVSRKRAQPLPPPERTVVALLAAFGALTVDGGLVSGPASPLDAGSVQMWLYELIESAPGGVLHSEEIIRAAIRDGKNLSSVANYLSYEPIVRRVDAGSGLMRLVGRTVTPEAADLASRIAVAQRRNTHISIAAEPDAVRVTLEVGSALLKNGVLNLQPEVVAIWPHNGALLTCSCGHAFTGRRKVLAKGQVTGWQTPLVHLILEHGLQEGGTVSMRLQEGTLTITDIAA